MLRAYRCWPEWAAEEEGSTVYADSPGKARYAYLLDVSDPLPDLTFTQVRSRSLGPAESTRCEALDRLAASYGLPPLPLGTAAEHAGEPCTVAGHRDGYVRFRREDGSVFCDHILSRKRYTLADGTVIDGDERAREIDARWAALNGGPQGAA